MKSFLAYFLQIVIGIGIYADHWLGIAELGNLSLALIWITSILSLFIGLRPSKDFFKHGRNPRQPIVRTLFFINSCLLFAVGWFFTGIVQLSAWIILWIRRIEWEKRTFF